MALNVISGTLRRLNHLFANFTKLAQFPIAAIGLTYSIDTGTDSHEIITKAGNVSVANLDCYYHNHMCATGPNTALDVTQDPAHTYGETYELR
ncbi:hypothetical protein MMC07_003152 [Pseudocyphellaria aurata]|nr:hypothetical protein [Pseudocyphellaria aurata]